MGLFYKIKNAIWGSSNNNQVGYQRPQRSNYIPTYHIEDWQPKLKYPEYDKLFSLQKYLESIDLPKNIISQIIESKNVFGEAKRIITHVTEQVPLSEMCYHETVRIEKWIKLMALWESPSEYIFENTFKYILLRLSWMCHWDMLQQKALNDCGLNDILDACKQNDYKKVVSYFDNDILSCFALSHLKSKKSLVEAVSIGFGFLEMNTTHNGSAHGSFYNLFGKQQIKGLIGKIIESAYIYNKFSTKKLFFKEENYVSVNTDSLKYDVSKMKSIRGFYLPNVSDKDNITKDILQLNDYLLQATTLVRMFPNIQIDANDIEFRFDKVLPDESTEFCTFIYTPNTPTGKTSKYPLKLGFYCKRTSNIQGEIEYLQNGEIGKSRIIIWHKGILYLVHILDKKGIKAITKIETTNKNGERITIYNVNKKKGE